MKTIILKKWVEDNMGKPFELSTTDCLKIALNTTPTQGFNPAEMRQRIKLLDSVEAIKKGQKEWKVEDNDWNKIKDCVNASTWGILSKNILEFTEQFA
ncbi:MAG: hypothetical protein EKK37_17305 [Sphingobacteriales bacterium]|nr:MAG: hypothetical protein EKK37_17305 [Sphingobacteriales bacterium]